MEILIQAVKRNWLAILFCLALCAFASIFLSNLGVTDGTFCSGDDKSVAVCARNWANSGGSLLTGLVALVAAMIAFNQLGENKKQVSTALLTPLKERLDDISLIHQQAKSVSNDYYELCGLINRMRIFIDEGVTNIPIKEHAAKIMNAEIKLDASRKVLYETAHSVRLYRDIAQVANQIVQSAYQRANNDAGILLTNCRAVSESVVDIPFEADPSIAQLRRESFYFGRAAPDLNDKHQRILGDLKKLESMALAVNDKRLAALALSKPD